MENGGWEGVVDAVMWLERRELGVVPWVPDVYRVMVRYVFIWSF